MTGAGCAAGGVVAVLVERIECGRRRSRLDTRSGCQRIEFRFTRQRTRHNKTGKPVILALNKIDLAKKAQVFSLVEEFKDLFDFKAVIPISAKKNIQVDQLLAEVESSLAIGPRLYPEETFTDVSEKFMVKNPTMVVALARNTGCNNNHLSLNCFGGECFDARYVLTQIGGSMVSICNRNSGIFRDHLVRFDP